MRGITQFLRTSAQSGTWFAASFILLIVVPQMATAQTQVTLSTPWRQSKPEQRLSRIAFGSCLDQRLAQPIWKSVIASKPDLFLMLGDNVYGDVSDASLKELKTAYTLQAVHPELAAARAAMPFLATWDDHDYGLNDASANFPHKNETRTLFADFWSLPRSSLPPEGIYRAHIIGPPGARVQIILLDLRTFRSPFERKTEIERAAAGGGPYKPDADPAKTMLGAAQWAWLEAQLRQPAEIRIVVSSVQLLANDTGWERWGHLPAEQAGFFALLASTDARGVVVVSGDRHRAAIYRKPNGLPYALVDITSSALNRSRAGSEPDDKTRLTAMLAEDNFGLLTIDWEVRRLRASLNTLSGREWHGLDISFAELGLAAAP